LAQVPLKLQVLHQGQPLRELQANTSAQDPGFAEVLPSLTDQEMDWLVLGELQMALERAGGPELRISGYITARQSCDVLQSVLCGADALIPVQTGAAGSASLILLGNGSLIYQRSNAAEIFLGYQTRNRERGPLKMLSPPDNRKQSREHSTHISERLTIDVLDPETTGNLLTGKHTAQWFIAGCSEGEHSLGKAPSLPMNVVQTWTTEIAFSSLSSV
ncbi:hypothetical protein STEG23_013846, partial [Scotinomys teguina]